MVTLVVLMGLYFLPAILASHRGHGGLGVLLVNLLLGWTGIGWLAMMVWALTLRQVVYVMPAPCYVGPVPRGGMASRGR